MTRDDFKSLLGSPLFQVAELLCYLETGSWHLSPLEVSLGDGRPQSANKWLERKEPRNGIQDRGAFIPDPPVMKVQHHLRKDFNFSTPQSSYLSNGAIDWGFWKLRSPRPDHVTSISMYLTSFHFIRSSKTIHMVCRGERLSIQLYFSGNYSTLNLEQT